jgi:serine/threonine protein kinase
MKKQTTSFSSKDNTVRKGTMHRRMKSEERTTSIYLNPNQKKKANKMYHEKSVSNRMNFKNEFDDYIQASTSRKTKNNSKKQKIDGTLPFVSNNSFGSYNTSGNPIFSMINSLNNSGALISNDHSTTIDKNSISVNNKASNSVNTSIPFKGKQFTGTNANMINYVKDLDYLMMVDGGKNGLQVNPENVHHNYSVNYGSTKIGNKKSLMASSQKNSKRISVERDNSKHKPKRSASDNNRILSSKGRKKEQSKSPPSHSTHSEYYNKMIAVFNQTGIYPNKSIRKTNNKSNKISNPTSAMLSKKNSKDLGSKKKIKSYYEPHNVSKTNDERQKSSNIRSLPLSLMNSFEKNSQEKAFKKKYKNTQIQNYQKVPNQQVFYHKGKVNVSGQHLKFSKPKSKSNMSQHSENPSHQFSKGLAFSGEITPISPFKQISSKNAMGVGHKKVNNKQKYNYMPNYPKNPGTGMTYDNMGYPTYHQPVNGLRAETNINVYDEEMSFMSSGENNSKHHSFYQDVGNSFQSQTYDNPRKKVGKRDNMAGYSYTNENQSKKMIMDKKTKMSKISEIMGHGGFEKKQEKNKKNRSVKAGYQHFRDNSKNYDERNILKQGKVCKSDRLENPNAGDNANDFTNNRDDLIIYLHDKDINQVSVDQELPQKEVDELIPKKKINKSAYQKVIKNKVAEYNQKNMPEASKPAIRSLSKSIIDEKSDEASPEVKLRSAKKGVPHKPTKAEREESKVKASKKIVKVIQEAFVSNNEPPATNADFYRAGKVLGKGAFGKVCLALHKLSKKLVALKLLNKEFLKNETSKEKVMQEVRILKRFRHPNVVKLFETFESLKHIVVVMELCAGGDLLNYVRKRRRLKEEYAKYIFKQIIEGIAHVHAKGVLHRDIKLDNILLDGKGIIKIADFGVSRIITNINDKMSEQCGTPAYIAPEILRDKGYYGFGCDMWSAGVVLYAMLYGTVPFKANNMNDLHKLIMKAKYTLKDDISEQSRDLLKNLLERDPNVRFKVTDVVAHPWMQDIPDTMVLFNDQEQQLIRDEFTYNNADRYNRNTKNKHMESIDTDRSRNSEAFEIDSDCFTEQRLDS